MGQIDNELKNSSEKRSNKIYGIVAVVLCFFSVLFAIGYHIGNSKQSTTIKVADNGVCIPELEMQSDEVTSMTAFFMYNGRSYCICDGMFLEKTAIGSCLGTAYANINEWSETSNYIDFSGTVSGEVYSINGISTEFMLCLVSDSENCQVFMNNKGITLNSGSEIFEEYLHVSESIESVTYETQESWDNAQSDLQKYLIDANEQRIVLNQFVAALNDGEWMRMKDIPKSEDGRTDYDLQEYHVYIKLKTGVTIHLRLLEGGYVNLEGLNWVCVKVNEDVYTSLIEKF